MHPTWYIIIAALVIMTGAGFGYGAYRAAMSPRFYAGVAKMAAEVLIPVLLPILMPIFKRKSPEQEAKDNHDYITKPNVIPMPSKFPRRDR